jgi:phage terminase large subunit-like protein
MKRAVDNPGVPGFLAGYKPGDPLDKAKISGEIREYLKLYYLQMNSVQESFVRVKNKQGRMPKTRLLEAGNQSGKTVVGVAEDIAHSMGFRPWLEPNDPDYRISIKVPNVGMLGCEVAGQTLAQRIEPLFMEFIPKFCAPQISRYSDGSLKSLVLTFDYNGKPCGSTIHFRSYVQPAESYEGMIFDWIHWDEPPPRAVLNAAERGKMSTNAPSWFTMTPLKEPYIYDIFSLKAFNNGGDDQEIAVFRGATWDNCQDWCRTCNITIEANQPESLAPGASRPVKRCPGCRKVMGFMPRSGIENYLKKITDPDEREAREEGKWKHLSGMVYKELARETHLYPDFDIPSDWMRIEVVDPHDAKPTRWLFGAVSPEEIAIAGKPANRIFWYSYLLLCGTIHDMVRQVKVRRAEKGYHHPAIVILDAKYGARTVKTADGETSWEEELDKEGIRNITLSHSAPGDVSLGHKVVKDYLRPQYSTLRGKEIPGMLFAAEGCGGDRGPIQDMFNYRWQIGSEKPEEDFKDMADCVRYAALEQPIYRRPEPEIDSALARMLLDREGQKDEYDPMRYGLVLKRG